MIEELLKRSDNKKKHFQNDLPTVSFFDGEKKFPRVTIFPLVSLFSATFKWDSIDRILINRSIYISHLHSFARINVRMEFRDRYNGWTA